MDTCGGNSVVECLLPKENVGGSNPLHRSGEASSYSRAKREIKKEAPLNEVQGDPILFWYPAHEPKSWGLNVINPWGWNCRSSSVVEQCFRKAWVVSSNLTFGSQTPDYTSKVDTVDT